MAHKGTAPVAFSNILAFENFLLLMIVIFGLQMVDRSLAPVMLLHLEALGYDPTAATRLVGVLFSLLALSGAAGNQLAPAALARASARVVITAAALVAAAALAWFASTRRPVGAHRRHQHRRRRPRRRHHGGLYGGRDRDSGRSARGELRLSDRRVAHRLGRGRR